MFLIYGAWCIYHGGAMLSVLLGLPHRIPNDLSVYCYLEMRELMFEYVRYLLKVSF